MKWIKMTSVMCFFIVFAAMFSITTYPANANSGDSDTQGEDAANITKITLSALDGETKLYLSHAGGKVSLQNDIQYFIVEKQANGRVALVATGEEAGQYLSHAFKKVWLQNGMHGAGEEWVYHKREGGIALEGAGGEAGLYLSHAGGKISFQKGYQGGGELWALSETILPDVSNSKNRKNGMLKGLWESMSTGKIFRFDGRSGVRNADNDSGTYEFDGERLVLTINGKTLKAEYWSQFGGSNLDFKDNHTERYRLFEISKFNKFHSSNIWTSNGSDKYIFEDDFTYTVQGRGEAFDGYSGKGSYAFTDRDNGIMTEDGRKPSNFQLPTGDSGATPDHVLTITAENGEVTRLKFSYESLSTKYGTLKYQLDNAKALEGDSYIKFTSANEVTIYDAVTGETRTGTYKSLDGFPSEIIITIDGKEIFGKHWAPLGNYWKFEDLGSGWFVYD